MRLVHSTHLREYYRRVVGGSISCLYENIRLLHPKGKY